MVRYSKWQIDPAVPQQGSVLERILAGRGILSAAARDEFLHGSVQDLHSPFELPDMEKACAMLMHERQSGRTVMIHGDYDADGISATALLVRVFAALGLKCTPLIPDRINDGYGIALDAVQKNMGPECNLLLTVDCGIANVHEVAALKASGASVIITDHHECPPQLPAADAIINPKREDSIYPFRELSGVGVACKLAQALCRQLPCGDLWLDLLDLVALGTIADVVPLRGENRILARLGLEKMNSQPGFGITALLARMNSQKKTVTAQTVSFQIGPRINAAGRIGQADAALQLLLADNMEEALCRADLLCEYNRQRLDLEADVLLQAQTQIENKIDLADQKIIIACGDNWHQGVLGIIASRLAERYHLPAIVLSRDDSGICKGSARSWADFNMYSALQQVRAHLLQFGGHSKAAGLSLEPEKLTGFITSLQSYAQHNWDFQPASIGWADLILSAEKLNLDLAYELQKLEPYGEGNPQPLLIAADLQLKQVRAVGSGKHLKVSFSGENNRLDGIGFGMGELVKVYQPGHRVDALFALEINTWMGVDKVQLNLRDLRPSDVGGDGFYG